MMQERNTGVQEVQREVRREAEGTLSARSAVASVLLGTEPPELPVRQLVRTAELFGVSQGAARVAISRMVAAGELVAVEPSRYRLAGHLLGRRARQEAGRHPVLTAWDGTWDVVTVAVEGARPPEERAELRARMRGALAGELREGVWTRPANLAGALPVPDGCIAFRSARVGDDAGLAARLWPLETWRRDGRVLLDEMAARRPALEEKNFAALAPAFSVAAAVVRLMAADPLLPPALLPEGWPGAEVRAAYDRFERALARLLREWFAAG